jgi:ribosome assembly protein 1
VVTLQTPNKQCTISISALPLPAEATKLLEDNVELLKELDRRIGLTDSENAAPESRSAAALSETALLNIADLKLKLGKVFDRSRHPELHGAVELIWSVGPRRCGPNVLIMHTNDAHSRQIW